jgi:hypothetical protein
MSTVFLIDMFTPEKDVAPPSWRLSWRHPAGTSHRTCNKSCEKLTARCPQDIQLEAGAAF